MLIKFEEYFNIQNELCDEKKKKLYLIKNLKKLMMKLIFINLLLYMELII